MNNGILRPQAPTQQGGATHNIPVQSQDNFELTVLANNLVTLTTNQQDGTFDTPYIVDMSSSRYAYDIECLRMRLGSKVSLIGANWQELVRANSLDLYVIKQYDENDKILAYIQLQIEGNNQNIKMIMDKTNIYIVGYCVLINNVWHAFVTDDVANNNVNNNSHASRLRYWINQQFQNNVTRLNHDGAYGSLRGDIGNFPNLNTIQLRFIQELMENQDKNTQVTVSGSNPDTRAKTILRATVRMISEAVRFRYVQNYIAKISQEDINTVEGNMDVQALLNCWQPISNHLWQHPEQNDIQHGQSTFFKLDNTRPLRNILNVVGLIKREPTQQQNENVHERRNRQR